MKRKKKWKLIIIKKWKTKWTIQNTQNTNKIKKNTNFTQFESPKWNEVKTKTLYTNETIVIHDQIDKFQLWKIKKQQKQKPKNTHICLFFICLLEINTLWFPSSTSNCWVELGAGKYITLCVCNPFGWTKSIWLSHFCRNATDHSTIDHVNWSHDHSNTSHETKKKNENFVWEEEVPENFRITG